MIFFVTQEECDKFVELYDKYKKIIYYTIKRFITNDEHIVEDISQEIYIILSKHLDNINLQNETRTRNYIITITRNYCKNYLRKHSKYEELPIYDSSFSNLESDEIFTSVAFQEQIEHLILEIEKLDDKYKCVLELKYVNEFTDEEIADFLKISKKTVQMRLYRSKILLRKKMREIYYD